MQVYFNLMGKLYSILLFLLCFVASTQLIAKYWAPYLLFDDLLLLVLTAICTLDLIINNSFSRTNVLLTFFLVCFLAFSFVINFYSLNAFLTKLFFYIKPMFVFTFVGYLANNYLKERHVRLLYKIFIFICLFAWVEFYWIQYVDFSLSRYFTISYRSGFYRASGLTWHPISLALLGFLSIVIGKEIIKDQRRWPYLVFAVAILLSGTRFVMLMTFVYVFYRYLSVRKFRLYYFSVSGKKIFLLMYPVIFLSIILLSSYINVKDHSSLRSVTFRTGLPLLANPKVAVLGTGVGSFGSYESVHEVGLDSGVCAGFGVDFFQSAASATEWIVGGRVSSSGRHCVGESSRV